MVQSVRDTIPELTLYGSSSNPHPRNFKGNTLSGLPISALDFPYLKYVFHTGAAREPLFSRFRDILGYNPDQDPLETGKSVTDENPFLSVASPTGELLKTYSISQILKDAKIVSDKLNLQPDQTVMLCTNGDPYSVLVGFLACLDARAQLLITESTDETSIDQIAEIENVCGTIGSSNVPKKTKQVVTL